MRIIKDEAGNDIEVYTKEELEAKTTEIKTSLEQEIADAKSKIEELEKGGTDDKNENIKNLRNLIEKKDKEIADIKTDIDQKINGVKIETASKFKDKLIAQAAAGNDELKKKIEIYYKEFGNDIADEDKILERVKNAVTLATGKEPSPSFLDNLSSMGGMGDYYIPKSSDSKVDETPNQKLMRGVFGISDEDAAKYSGKVYKKSN